MQRLDSHSKKIECRSNLTQHDSRLASTCLRLAKDVREDSTNVIESGWIAIYGHFGAAQVVEPADIIQTHNMIRVRMGNENGIYALDIESETLQPQFGSGIDQYVPFTACYKY
jgi:hypothetical protein